MCTRLSHGSIICSMAIVQRSVHVILLLPSRSSRNLSPALKKNAFSHRKVTNQLLRRDNNAKQWSEDQQKSEISVGVCCVHMLNESQMFDCEEAAKKKKKKKKRKMYRLQTPTQKPEYWPAGHQTVPSVWMLFTYQQSGSRRVLQDQSDPTVV